MGCHIVEASIAVVRMSNIILPIVRMLRDLVSSQITSHGMEQLRPASLFFISFYDIGWRVSQVTERGQIMQNSGFKLDKLDLQRSFVSLGIADILQKGNTSSRQLWHLQKGIVKWAIESKLEVGELVLKVSMSLYDREFDSRTYLKDNGESLWESCSPGTQQTLESWINFFPI